MTNSIHNDADLSNVHPVDALAEVRAEIKSLQVKEANIRAKVLANKANLIGDAYEGVIENQKSMRLDQDKLTKALGDLEPYKSETTVLMVKVRKRK